MVDRYVEEDSADLEEEQFVDGALWADGEPFPSDIGLPKTTEAKAQSADGEPFPAGIGLPGEAKSDAQSADAKEIGRMDRPGEENGRPSDDAHTSESMYGAPGGEPFPDEIAAAPSEMKG